MSLTNTIKDHMDNVTSPVAAVPVAGTSVLFGEYLPLFINVVSAIYLVLLVTHKGWQMYKEWKEKKDAPVQ